MRRRGVLAGVCACFAAPGFWYTTRSPRRSITVRFWLSERAAKYDGIYGRIASHLEASLEEVYDGVTVSFGGTVDVGTEHGYWVTRSGEWPRRIGGGLAGSGDVSPSPDVNLLVTDGTMDSAPTGAALPHVASVGGARHLESLRPREETGDVLENASPAHTMQVLLHEVGHALGLEHEHGSIVTADGETVASPMVSTYAWSDDPYARRQFDDEQTACGGSYPIERDGDRRLSLTFSACASANLREYDGGFLL